MNFPQLRSKSLQFHNFVDGLQVELIALPEEDEGPQHVAHGQQCDPVSASQKHHCEGHPVGGEENCDLEGVQHRPDERTNEIEEKNSYP